ncbi:MAG: hypothetical protein WD749_14015 [Phycisphaerales bacterium]
MVAYETRLQTDPRWALSEGSRHFEDRSAVHDTLRRVTARLNDLGIPYAVSGGMALFHHGLRRFTEDVDILVTTEGLRGIHDSLVGLGYLPVVAGGKGIRDTQTGVRIDFIISGEYPGDGKPKPVRFPDPSGVALEHDHIRYLNLPTLIELKLASGMTNPARLRDLSDVLELIRLLALPPAFAEQHLSPFVREKFLELHRAGASEPAGP